MSFIAFPKDSKRRAPPENTEPRRNSLRSDSLLGPVPDALFAKNFRMAIPDMQELTRHEKTALQAFFIIDPSNFDHI